MLESAVISRESDKGMVSLMNKKTSLLFLTTAALVLSGCMNTASVDESVASSQAEVSESRSSADQTTSKDAASNQDTANTEEAAEEDLFNKVRNNEPTSDRINALKQIAMQYYWYGGDMKKAEEELFQGITLHGKYDVVEQSFARAITIDPFDTDLKRSLASAQVLQNKLPEALMTLQDIIDIDPNNAEAYILHGAYSKVMKDQDTFETDMNRLSEINPTLGKEYQEKFDSVDEILQTPLNVVVPTGLPSEKHVIVTLGYALSDEGEMQETLVERLKVTLEVAKAYPDAVLIVTGGVPKNDHTEAERMYDWLVEQGIDENRIRKEALATDTVENALFSMDIIREEGLQDVTLITSASHMRRALTTFTEASDFMDLIENKDSNRRFTNVVYMDFDTPEEAQEVSAEEEMVIYRDLVRTSGIWQFPGLQR